MTAKPATPLPWTDPRTIAASFGVWAGDVQVATCRVVYDDGSTVPYMVNHDGDAAQNAAYIVEACNAYPRLMAEREELVAALRKVVKEFRPLGLRMAQPDAGFMKTGNAIVAMCDSFSELLARIEGAE